MRDYEAIASAQTPKHSVLTRTNHSSSDEDIGSLQPDSGQELVLGSAK